jgi:hypothetical protein
MSELYAKFLQNYRGGPFEQKLAYEAAKEYLNKYGDITSDGNIEVLNYLRVWSGKYEEAVDKFWCVYSFDKEDYEKAFQACGAALSRRPDDIGTALLLARAGYADATSQSPHKALNAEAARMARRAVELIESGKTPASWSPFPSRGETLGFLHYAEGVFTRETSPADAAAAFIKAAQSDSRFNRESSTYTYLAAVYETDELTKLVNEYTSAFPPGVPISDEKREQYDRTLAQVSRVQDRIIDAYARAAAIMNADPNAHAAKKDAVMKKLKVYYKARHEDSDAGLLELILGVMSKPLMLPGREYAPSP